MDPIIIEAVKTVFLEAIKVLGPAIITGLLTYKATKSQMEIKLREVEQSHAFGAREHWFNYYKERQERLARDHERLNEGLGQILGMASTVTEVDREANSQIIVTLAETVLTFSKLTASEIEATVRDFDEQGFSKNPDQEKLQEYLNSIRRAEFNTTFESLKRNLFLLLEVHQFLQRCNDQLLKQQMKSTFQRYAHV